LRPVVCINQYVTQLFADVVNELASQGQNVVLLSGKLQDLERPVHNRVRHVRLTAYRRNNAVLRIFTWLAFSVQTFFYLLFKLRVRAILVTSNPPAAPYLAGWISRWRRTPLYLLVYDVYPDALINFGYLRPGGFLHRFWSAQNRILFRRAEALFTLSPSLVQSLEAYFSPDHPARPVMVSCWVDSDFIRPLSRKKNPFITEHALEKAFVVLYSGNLGATHDIDSILRLAERLEDQRNIRFIIIGEGAQRQKLELHIRRHNPPNLVLMPRQPAARLPYTFAAADIGIVTLGKGAEGLSVPSKTFYYLAAGVPLLAISAPGSELDRLVRDSGSGEVFSPGDTPGMYSYVLRLYGDREQAGRLAQRARETALQHTRANAGVIARRIAGFA
jgi:glycosyltransferase involved in cell wall biosynthesis